MALEKDEIEKELSDIGIDSYRIEETESGFSVHAYIGEEDVVFEVQNNVREAFRKRLINKLKGLASNFRKDAKFLESKASKYEKLASKIERKSFNGQK